MKGMRLALSLPFVLILFSCNLFYSIDSIAVKSGQSEKIIPETEEVSLDDKKVDEETGEEGCEEEDADDEEAVEEEGIETDVETETDTETDTESDTNTEDLLAPYSINDFSNPDDVPIKQREPTYKLCLLIYMPADNNLEAEALNDIYEMESSKLNTGKYKVLFLVDRNPEYESSNGNWTGTKLYELKTDRKEDQKQIISKEIDCEALGLKKGENTELDMSSEYVLSTTVQFMKSSYKAENYGLIMWGHGTGWRSEADEPCLSQTSCRALAFDSTSNSYMSLKQFGQALKAVTEEEKLDFIGFDTCFGTEMEVMYEIRNCARYAAGSEGLVLAGGWNYEKFFNYIEEKSFDEILSVCFYAYNQFVETYKNNSGSQFSVIDLSYMDELFENHEGFMKYASMMISSPGIRDDLIREIYSKLTMFSYGTSGSDVYFDSYSLDTLVYKLLEKYKNANSALFTNLSDQYQKSSLLYSKTVCRGWGYEDGNGTLGIFFGTLSSSGLFSCIHPDAYVKGKTFNQIDFVNDSEWYVPKRIENESFIDKLFYNTEW